jgi:hypothetical protein
MWRQRTAFLRSQQAHISLIRQQNQNLGFSFLCEYNVSGAGNATVEVKKLLNGISAKADD